MADEFNRNNKSDNIDVTKPRPARGNAMPTGIDRPINGSAMPKKEGGKPISGGAMPTYNPNAPIKDDVTKQREHFQELSNKVSHTKIKEKKDISGAIKTIVAVILVLVVIGLAVMFIVVIGQNTETEESDYEIRVSMQIDNKSSLTVVSESGREELKKIEPGDLLGIGATVRNANNITGDVNDGYIPPNVYVRFRVYFILDYKERFDVLIPTVNSNVWYKYNEEDEKKLIDGVRFDDNYYYLLGSLTFQQQAQLFSEILVDGNSLTCDDGGKYGQIQVEVEVIEADINAIRSEGVWNTAPRAWVMQMTTMGMPEEL